MYYRAENKINSIVLKAHFRHKKGCELSTHFLVQGASIYIDRLAPCTKDKIFIFKKLFYIRKCCNFEPEKYKDERLILAQKCPKFLCR
jgi:hypothetical protein